MIGKVLSCVGGLYTVDADNTLYQSVAKGSFRHSKMTVMAGDTVEFDIDSENKGLIKEVLERKNFLIRPEVANIDVMFVVFALSSPDPNFLAIDKLTVLTEHSGIDTVIVFNKCDLVSDEKREEMKSIYERAGYKVVLLSAKSDSDKVREELLPLAKGKVAVFSGPSGVGKSTIINALYPDLQLETGHISEKNRRGKNTTRTTILHKTKENDGTYLVDTPGFTLLDFDRFRFIKKEELAFAFREYAPLALDCRYTKCSHTKEEGCKILEKIKDGTLPQTRHTSFLALWDILKNHKDWEN